MGDPTTEEGKAILRAAFTAKKIPVTYVLYPDEGLGFAKPNNRIGFNAVAEEHVPGLKEAVAQK